MHNPTQPIRGTVGERLTVAAFYDGATLLVRVEVQDVADGEPVVVDLTAVEATKMCVQLLDGVYDVLAGCEQ